ncbi:MAG: DUF6057 family protein [Bacteroidales bacterium]|nr:DUF6057 family protein [Bacteroidales bacterium]
MKRNSKSTVCLYAALACGAAWAFFQFAYPYHLVRREQVNLFLFDWDYLLQTYRGAGWLARLAGDFLEQFFHLSVVGPLLVALLLTGIGAVAYRIARWFLGRGPSLGVAALFFFWAFLRETGGFYLTRYTVAVLAYLSLILLALCCKRRWMRPVAAVLLLGSGAWALGAPFHHEYGRAWSVPDFTLERAFGLDAEVARERWGRVLELSREDQAVEEACYCYNLAHAMKGDLGETLFNHAQNHQHALLFPVSSERSIFTNTMAGEAWFHLGDLTVAEQSAITSLQASPRHTGARFLVRLARINLISGEEGAAQKYLDILSKTLFYGKWARCLLAGERDEATRRDIEQARQNLIRRDRVHRSEDPRATLLELLRANPSNELARNYLLCYDLLCYDLDAFMEDYTAAPVPGRLYREAILIWLSQKGRLNPAEVIRYGVDVSEVDRMGRFGRSPAKYKNTYWYYYLQALE